MPSDLRPPIEPMEARPVAEVPRGTQWQYEPKWDGFRCIVFRTGADVYLQSKALKPLARYFPELVAMFLRLPPKRFVLDGEIVIPIDGRLAFDELLMRIHPATSRVKKLAAEHPASYVAFDLLADAAKPRLLDEPLSTRRERLEQFHQKWLQKGSALLLSPATVDPAIATQWFEAGGVSLDGLIAKRTDLPYRSGERDGMQKIKFRRTADCVVGGFRYAEGAGTVGSLLLGLYDDQGLLHHVGFTSSFPHASRAATTMRLKRLMKPPGFTGRAPGGPSRWSTKRTSDWQPVAPELVVEVEYDHVSQDRFRHGTRFLRWRPDKQPASCTFDQIQRPDIRLSRLPTG